MFWRATLIWILMLVIAVTAGVLRSERLEPHLGEQGAHVVGTFVVTSLFALLIWATVGWIDPYLEGRPLLTVGVGWTVATIGFEFMFGHFVAGHSWSRLLADYNILAGRLWALVLLTVLLGPVIAGSLRRAPVP